jgi:hypothetical protein
MPSANVSWLSAIKYISVYNWSNNMMDQLQLYSRMIFGYYVFQPAAVNTNTDEMHQR